ncbi:pentapeptide repeat-containing protein [Nostoc sp. NZL]|uniref:pentapeptide repeat-containing protein n=1 Tax=Nostoc sp. NZL TaxID=2650612 RepID=UPI001E39E4F4|nr:pentapeptide repeat-containing protein [Nostoc sp. NZL]MBG1242213.1 hypothetical protein [Nostoc sp. NZL]
MLSESNRVHQIDKKFDDNISNDKFMNHLFVRLVAKDKQFTKVDFKYSIFDTCYLRGCKFDSCDFTGCRFVGTNLHGAKFSGCKFEYSTFERTVVDNYILDTECPGSENLKMKFARTLRMNYQQLGDAESVNKAIRIELQATEVHLHKAWSSKESYYRKKYTGLKRLETLLEWTNFKFFDLVWGNGESPWKLLRATIIILLLMSLIDVWEFKNTQSIYSYIQAFIEAPQIFLGTLSPSAYPSPYFTLILFIRLVEFGLFMSILIKRLNRR